MKNIQEKTTILASKSNIESITTFFTANKLIPGIQISKYKIILSIEDESDVYTEKYYNAISIEYIEDDDLVSMLLLTLVARHGGLENMLVDYLRKLKAWPIFIDAVYTKQVSNKDVNNHYRANVAPKLEPFILKTPDIHINKSYTE